MSFSKCLALCFQMKQFESGLQDDLWYCRYDLSPRHFKGALLCTFPDFIIVFCPWLQCFNVHKVLCLILTSNKYKYYVNMPFQPRSINISVQTHLRFSFQIVPEKEMEAGIGNSWDWIFPKELSTGSWTVLEWLSSTYICLLSAHHSQFDFSSAAPPSVLVSNPQWRQSLFPVHHCAPSQHAIILVIIL